MEKRFSFEINAELYENRTGEMAIRFPGDRVFRAVGTGKGESFVRDTVRQICKGRHPSSWQEMAAHELVYGQDWHCIGRLGFVDGDQKRPAVELDAGGDEISEQARLYLREVLH